LEAYHVEKFEIVDDAGVDMVEKTSEPSMSAERNVFRSSRQTPSRRRKLLLAQMLKADLETKDWDLVECDETIEKIIITDCL
jgi:hypothetical protein